MVVKHGRAMKRGWLSSIGYLFKNNFLLPPASDPSVCALNSVSHAQKEDTKRLGNGTQGFWEGGGRRKTEARLDKPKAHHSKMYESSKKSNHNIVW